MGVDITLAVLSAVCVYISYLLWGNPLVVFFLMAAGVGFIVSFVNITGRYFDAQ